MKKEERRAKHIKNEIFKATIAVIVVLTLMLVNQSKQKIMYMNKLKDDILGLQENLQLKEEEIAKANSEKQDALNDIQELENDYTSLKYETDNIIKELDKKQFQIENLTKEIIGDKVKDIVESIKVDNLNNISKYVHSERGIRFSPTAEINEEKHKIVFQNLDELVKDKSKCDWGLFDANGKVILLTFEEYYKQYIKDEDCINSGNIKYANENTNRNSLQIKESRLRTNEVYENTLFADCVYKGTQENNFADWKSIRFVFEEIQSVWYLTGIITNKG